MTTPTTPQDRATAETDLLTCDGKTLQDFLYRIFNANPQRSALCDYEAFRDAIVRQALATRPVSARALTDAEVRNIDHAVTHEYPTLHRASYTFADKIIRAAFALGASSSPDADALTAAKREGWDAAAEFWYPAKQVWSRAQRQSFDAERDRRYPIAPPSVVLSDGSVVRYEPEAKHTEFKWVRRFDGTDYRYHHWFACLNHTHSGADFDTLKAFAATLSPTTPEGK